MQPTGQSPLGPPPPGWIGAGPIDNPYNPVAAPTAAPRLPGGGGTASIIPQAPHVPLSTGGGSVPPPQINVPPPQGPPAQSSPFDSDPAVYGASSAENLGVPHINNVLNNLIAQRIAAYGDPSFAAQAGFGLDPQAAAFARQNYLSGNAELARIDKSREQARRAIINALAGHGLLDSGETGYQIGNADQTYGNTVYDAQQKLLADIHGYSDSAQSQRDALHNSLIDALHGAYQFGIDHPGLYGAVPPPGNPPPAAPPPVTTTKPPKPPTTKKTANPVLSALAARSAGLNKQYGLD